MSRGIFLLRLARQSAWNRRTSLLLTVCSIALSTFLLLGVERVRSDVRGSFTSALSGTDLIVGARGGSVQLLLYSVFHMGAASHNIRFQTVQQLEALRGVAWVVPLSLGDSHQGFPVLGTTQDYFTHFHYGARQPLRLRTGKHFSDLYDAVIGAEVAERLGYAPGQQIALTHGTTNGPGSSHADKPFVVSGILARTGTPVDRTVHISLEAMEAIHVDWVAGAPLPGLRVSAEQARSMDLRPKSVTAALVGLHSRAAVFSVQRQVNALAAEPLQAILPGVALDELWRLIGTGEKALLLMSCLVALVSLASLVSVILAGLGERRRELAVLRAAGAGARHILLLLALEGAMLTLCGVCLGVCLLAGGILVAAPWLQSWFGITLQLARPTALQAWLLLALVLGGWLASLLPGWRAYRLSLADGLCPRI